MKINTLLLFLFLNSFLFSQNRFHALCNQACKALEEGMMDHAFILLTDAFSLNVPAKAADYLNMAKCYSQQNLVDSTEKYIYLAFERNRKIGKVIRVHSLWFEPILGEKKWNEIVELTKSESSELSEELQKVNQLFSDLYIQYLAIALRYDVKNESFYRDSLLLREYWKEVNLLTDSIAPYLDSILLNTPIELLIHPASEESFLLLQSRIKQGYFEERRELFESLISKGFLTPDLLIEIYVKEYFGFSRDQISTWAYNPDYFEFYTKYGTIMDAKMYVFRISNCWNYDD